MCVLVALAGCKGGSGYSNTRITGGDYGSNYDVYGTSTVRFAGGRYGFYCAFAVIN